ncbi:MULTISPECIES: hypothetical protein [Metabacillus]|nr:MULTISPECIES: hypothetical protein [Metabacillus]MDX8289650.1 hypothetical protein [Metabacillus indicus]
MIYKKSSKAPKVNSAVYHGSSQYSQQQLSGGKKAGCGCGKKKIVVKD